MKLKKTPNYSKKILSLKKLKKIVNKTKQKIILCHGNFDVVHPGHIRHLTYAKSKADILIVSITADRHIKKGTYRPFVPENIRATSLAAFEMVDYVVVDDNEKPLKLLKEIKPNFFAKGFEYSSGGLPPATEEEKNLVEKYGGEMIFTPGDIVYSSTSLLKLSEPKIENYKILDLMEKNDISFEKLIKDLSKFKKKKVHVIGDLIIDTYTNTTLIGGQTKTPTPSVLFNYQQNFVGGAGIVAKHLKAAGADVHLTTVLGNDELKDFTINELKKEKIAVTAIIDNTRPTINKNCIIANDYKIIKVDKVDNQSISEKILDKINKSITSVKADGVILSDFRHGIFNKNSINSITKSIANNIFKVADSQVATRWGNITDFKNFNLITPNEKEIRFSLADQDSNISQLTRRLQEVSNFKNLILKLGSKGAVGVSKSSKPISFSIPSFVNRLVDAVGAGDALLAYATLSLISGSNLLASTIVGSIAAACECEIDGNNAIEVNTVKDKILSLKEKFNYSS
jgi:rfaE bifunctional protein kinase chain/domain/rfaE bifunctional protein nucleotidyltransferase chain/domain